MNSKEVRCISAQILTSSETRLNEFKRIPIHLAKERGKQRGSERPSDSHAAPTKKRSMFLMTPAGETTSTQKKENTQNCNVQFLIFFNSALRRGARIILTQCTGGVTEIKIIIKNKCFVFSTAMYCLIRGAKRSSSARAITNFQ